MTYGRRDEAQRVVVTGMGVTTAIGESLAEYLDSLKAGRSGVTRWKHLDDRNYSKIGGDMSGFEFNAYLDKYASRYTAPLKDAARKILRGTPLPGQMVAASALQAYVDAGLPDGAAPDVRRGHVLAGHNLNGNYIRESVLSYVEDPEFIDPLYGMVLWDTDVLAKTSELLNLKGPTFTLGNACASGNLALMCGLDMIRTGRADLVLVTASSQALDPILLQAWSMMDVIVWQSFSDEPWRASRPFDRRREGFVPSEGAGAVVLESLTGARARGARIRAELLGAASASDATRTAKPNLEGQVRVMREALRDARVDPSQVNYVNAHATSTIVGDVVEVEAIKTVFGDRAYKIPVNSTKSMLGHCLTASGLVEFAATVLEMENEFVHPTINLEDPDEGMDLDFVANECRPYHIDVALSNSFGFGGLNASIVAARPPTS